jgi:hypothetical protein
MTYADYPDTAKNNAKKALLAQEELRLFLWNACRLVKGESNRKRRRLKRRHGAADILVSFTCRSLRPRQIL